MQAIDINSLVRQILADLGPAEKPGIVPVQNITPQMTPNIKPNIPPNKMASQPAEPRITSRVVSLAELARIGDVRRLIVPAQAVITPAVRDEIRKRNIELIRETSENSPVSTVKMRVWLALHLLKKEPTTLIEYLNRQYDFQKESFECILKTMQKAGEMVLSEPERTSCVVLSPYSPGAICVANRRPEIRAVLGTDPNTLKIDADQIGANLLVVDPDRAGPFKTQSLVRLFLADGVRRIPKYLRSEIKNER